MSLTKGRFGHSHRQAEGRCPVTRPKHHGESQAAEVSVAKWCPRFAGTPLAGKGPGSLLFEQVSERSLTIYSCRLEPHGCGHAQPAVGECCDVTLVWREATGRRRQTRFVGPNALTRGKEKV